MSLRPHITLLIATILTLAMHDGSKAFAGEPDKVTGESKPAAGQEPKSDDNSGADQEPADSNQADSSTEQKSEAEIKETAKKVHEALGIKPEDSTKAAKGITPAQAVVSTNKDKSAEELEDFIKNGTELQNFLEEQLKAHPKNYVEKPGEGTRDEIERLLQVNRTAMDNLKGLHVAAVAKENAKSGGVLAPVLKEQAKYLSELEHVSPWVKAKISDRMLAHQEEKAAKQRDSILQSGGNPASYYSPYVAGLGRSNSVNGSSASSLLTPNYDRAAPLGSWNSSIPNFSNVSGLNPNYSSLGGNTYSTASPFAAAPNSSNNSAAVGGSASGSLGPAATSSNLSAPAFSSPTSSSSLGSGTMATTAGDSFSPPTNASGPAVNQSSDGGGIGNSASSNKSGNSTESGKAANAITGFSAPAQGGTRHGPGDDEKNPTKEDETRGGTKLTTPALENLLAKPSTMSVTTPTGTESAESKNILATKSAWQNNVVGRALTSPTPAPTNSAQPPVNANTAAAPNVVAAAGTPPPGQSAAGETVSLRSRNLDKAPTQTWSSNLEAATVAPETSQAPSRAIRSASIGETAEANTSANNPATSRKVGSVSSATLADGFNSEKAAAYRDDEEEINRLRKRLNDLAVRNDERKNSRGIVATQTGQTASADTFSDVVAYSPQNDPTDPPQPNNRKGGEAAETIQNGLLEMARKPTPAQLSQLAHQTASTDINNGLNKIGAAVSIRNQQLGLESIPVSSNRALKSTRVIAGRGLRQFNAAMGELSALTQNTPTKVQPAVRIRSERAKRQPAGITLQTPNRKN